MPSPSAFSEMRIKFLESAVAENNKKITTREDWESFVLQTIRRFIMRFPLNLGDKTDPSQESYDAVDDSVVAPEMPMPELGTREYDAEVVVRQEQAERRKALSKV